MLGAIVGDIIGSSYERFVDNVKTTDFKLFPEGRYRYTDDTVQTLAVAKWLLEDKTHSESRFRDILRQVCRKHFYVGFSRRTKAWICCDSPNPCQSLGNGSAMRVSPVSLYARTMEEALYLSMVTASITHNTYEGIRGAMATASCVFMAKHHTTKEEVRSRIREIYGYELSRTIEEIRPTYGLDYRKDLPKLSKWRSDTCPGSVPEAIESYLEGESFEQVLRLSISLGGDSDTIAAIACSIAGADYEIPNELSDKCYDLLPEDLRQILDDFEELVRIRMDRA